MEATKEETIAIALKLSKREAELLKILVQNAVCNNETQEFSQLRYNIWNCLDAQGIRS